MIFLVEEKKLFEFEQNLTETVLVTNPKEFLTF